MDFRNNENLKIMKTLFVIQKAKKHIRKSTVLAIGDGDINRISICYNGIQGYINRSGAILSRFIEAEKIMQQKEKVSKLMSKLFGSDFKELYIATTNDKGPGTVHRHCKISPC